MKTILTAIILTFSLSSYSGELTRLLTIEIMDNIDKIYGNKKCEKIQNRGRVLDSLSTLSEDGKEIVFKHAINMNSKKYIKHLGRVILFCDASIMRVTNAVKKVSEKISKKNYSEMKNKNVYDAYVK